MNFEEARRRSAKTSANDEPSTRGCSLLRKVLYLNYHEKQLTNVYDRSIHLTRSSLLAYAREGMVLSNSEKTHSRENKKQGNLQEAREHYAETITLTEATASKLDDASLKNTLLTAPETKAMRDAYAGIQPE